MQPGYTDFAQAVIKYHAPLTDMSLQARKLGLDLSQLICFDQTTGEFPFPLMPPEEGISLAALIASHFVQIDPSLLTTGGSMAFTKSYVLAAVDPTNGKYLVNADGKPSDILCAIACDAEEKPTNETAQSDHAILKGKAYFPIMQIGVPILPTYEQILGGTKVRRHYERILHPPPILRNRTRSGR